MATCQACENEQHHLCGMQTWCECECDGSPEWGVFDPPDLPEINNDVSGDFYET